MKYNYSFKVAINLERTRDGKVEHEDIKFPLFSDPVRNYHTTIKAYPTPLILITAIPEFSWEIIPAPVELVLKDYDPSQVIYGENLPQRIFHDSKYIMLGDTDKRPLVKEFTKREEFGDIGYLTITTEHGWRFDTDEIELCVEEAIEKLKTELEPSAPSPQLESK